MARWSLLPLLLGMACAHSVGNGAAQRPGGDQAAAQRIYGVAEERFAAGDYDQAVELMRHSLLQLPPSPEHDRLRHQLVLRMAHTQLQAYTASSHTAPLQDAQQMLTRYLARHEQLFGETEAALVERGEVYELLYEVERRLEPPVASDPSPPELTGSTAAGDRTSEEPISEADVGTAEVDTEASDIAAIEPAAIEPASIEPARGKVERHEPASGEDENGRVRDVFVRNERFASLDDPGVRAHLQSNYSAGWSDLVLTAPGVELMHGPRPLVRGWSRLAGPGDRSDKQLARRAGQTLLRGARPTLRSCYAAAYARDPIMALQSTVEASIHPDGSVSHVRIVDGGLVDGYGDACVIEAMQGITMAPLAEVEDPVRVQVALTFFYEEALYIVEGTGEQVHTGGVILRPNPRRQPGLPPIEHQHRSGGYRGRYSAGYGPGDGR